MYTALGYHRPDIRDCAGSAKPIILLLARMRLFLVILLRNIRYNAADIMFYRNHWPGEATLLRRHFVSKDTRLLFSQGKPGVILYVQRIPISRQEPVKPKHEKCQESQDKSSTSETLRKTARSVAGQRVRDLPANMFIYTHIIEMLKMVKKMTKNVVHYFPLENAW